EALNFALIKYGNLKRKSGNIPYFIHPLRITLILRAAGFSEFENEEIMIAALLHDLIEDTDISSDEIEAKFGKKVASIVNELTISDKNIKDQYLEDLKYASYDAKIIKLADRIDNLIDIPTSSWSKDKQKDYAEQAKKILKSCGDAHSELAIRLNQEIDKILDRV
ncbi:MAG: HD domain-containing protein, partial [Promethearchaeota archaeon]